MKQFHVAQAGKNDIRALLTMIRELAGYENLQEQVTATESLLRDAMCGPSPVAYAWIAHAEKEPAGYAVYYRSFSTFTGRLGVFLDDIYVRPSYRRQGLGRKLMQCIARAGAEADYSRCEWITLRWNEAALRFYGNLGARFLDDWVFIRMNGEPLQQLIRSQP